MQKQTYFPTKQDQKRDWVLINLDGAVLGRAATRIANILRGKHKPTYTPHFDMGDFVVAINAAKVKLTGAKWQKKIYYRHSGYKGGLKETTAAKMLERKPEELIRLAVSGMLPKNKSRPHLLKKLKVYVGEDHPHQAQKVEAISLNDKEVTAAKSPKKATTKVTKTPAKKKPEEAKGEKAEKEEKAD